MEVAVRMPAIGLGARTCLAPLVEQAEITWKVLQKKSESGKGAAEKMLFKWQLSWSVEAGGLRHVWGNPENCRQQTE